MHFRRYGWARARTKAIQILVRVKVNNINSSMFSKMYFVYALRVLAIKCVTFGCFHMISCCDVVSFLFFLFIVHFVCFSTVKITSFIIDNIISLWKKPMGCYIYIFFVFCLCLEFRLSDHVTNSIVTKRRRIIYIFSETSLKCNITESIMRWCISVAINCSIVKNSVESVLCVCVCNF